jgi:thiol-disulfide isomerase/thioredoxin
MRLEQAEEDLFGGRIMRTLARGMALLLVGAALIGCIATSTNSGLSNGRAAPDIRGTDADGQSFQLSDYRGKVVLLDFWASFCGPCRSMFAHERSLVDKYQGRPFALIGVNADSLLEEFQLMQKKERLNWRSWWDGAAGPIGLRWKVDALPTLFLLDSKGDIRWKHEGVPSLKQMDELIAKLVKETESESSKQSVAKK